MEERDLVRKLSLYSSKKVILDKKKRATGKKIIRRVTNSRSRG